MNWIYTTGGNNIVLKVPPQGVIGFVYMINFDNGKSYIGRKNFWSHRKRKFGKKELAKLTDKRLKKYEIVTKESNWISYTSSNDDVNELIKNGEGYKKTILRLCMSKKELSYFEEKYLFMNGVLESDRFLNMNIAGRYYKSDIWE